MPPRKRKQAQKTAAHDSNGLAPNGDNAHVHATNNANGSSSHDKLDNASPQDSASVKENIKDALTKLSHNLPKNAKIEVRHPSLSRNPSVADYLHQALFVHDQEVKDHKKHVAPATRRRVILLLGIIIGMGLATVLMRQSKDAAYMEAFSHYLQDFDIASMVPSGMIPEEFIGNVSAMFKPEILTEEEFYPGEEMREEHGYKAKYPVSYLSRSSFIFFYFFGVLYCRSC